MDARLPGMTELLQFELRLRESVATIPPEVRAVLLEVLTSAEERRALEIGSLNAAGLMPATVELLIDAEAEEDSALTPLPLFVARVEPDLPRGSETTHGAGAMRGGCLQEQSCATELQMRHCPTSELQSSARRRRDAGTRRRRLSGVSSASATLMRAGA
jgi:hypothetical protein